MAKNTQKKTEPTMSPAQRKLWQKLSDYDRGRAMGMAVVQADARSKYDITEDVVNFLRGIGDGMAAALQRQKVALAAKVATRKGR